MELNETQLIGLSTMDVPEDIVMDDQTEDKIDLMVQFKKLKEQCKEHLLFFMVGDFYEMYFEDAVIGADALDIKLTEYKGNKDIPMCGFQHRYMRKFLMKALNAGLTVALTEQTDALNKDKKSALGKDRHISRIITPGTVQEYELFENWRNNYICYVYQSRLDEFGICTADITTGEFKTTNVNGITKLVDELYKLGPAELLVNKRCFENETKEILELKLQIKIGLFDNDAFTKHFIEGTISNFYDGKSPVVLGIGDYNSCIMATGLMLIYLCDKQRENVVYLNKISYYNTEDYMLIDKSSRKNLELTENTRTGKKRGSLLEVLDFTKTAMGARQLRKWIAEPLRSTIKINARLDAITEFLNSPNTSKLLEVLKGIMDLERMASKIIYKSAGLNDLVEFKNSIKFLGDIQLLIEQLDNSIMRSITAEFSDLSNIYELLSSMIDDENMCINPNCSAELSEYISINAHSESLVDALMSREQEKKGLKGLKIIVKKSRKEGVSDKWLITIPKSKLKGVDVSDYTWMEENKTQVRYTSAELEVLEKKIADSVSKISEISESLFSDMLNYLMENIEAIKLTAKQLGEIDAILSLATVAHKYDYCRPEVNMGESIKIEGGRHAVVEQYLATTAFVPNNTDISTHKNMVSIITGSNMSGKSTYMRQVALIVLMAQIGSYVPAETAIIGVVDKIFTRVGAADDLVAGESTYMMEMTEIANILANATENSLIILDEVGRGTSTYDGMSIAKSVLNYILKKIKAKTLFATHYHELTRMSAESNLIQNYCIAVEEHGDDIKLLYKIYEGISNNSYGIQIAKMAGLPMEVIVDAKKILQELNSLSISIANLDVDNLSPIQALNILKGLQ